MTKPPSDQRTVRFHGLMTPSTKKKLEQILSRNEISFGDWIKKHVDADTRALPDDVEHTIKNVTLLPGFVMVSIEDFRHLLAESQKKFIPPGSPCPLCSKPPGAPHKPDCPLA